MSHAENTTTRRGLLSKTVQVGATAVTLPAFASVAQGDTPSGNVELSITASVPASTSLSITIFEDTTGDGTADRQQTESISDTTTTVEYDLLESTVASGDTLWAELSLSTTDDSVSPSVDSMTITLPDTSTTPGPTTPTATPVDFGGDEPSTLLELWHNFYAFVAIIVMGFAGIGLASRSMAVAAWPAYLAFVYIALSTDNPLFRNIAYVSLVVIMVGMAFKVWRAEFGGEE